MTGGAESVRRLMPLMERLAEQSIPFVLVADPADVPFVTTGAVHVVNETGTFDIWVGEEEYFQPDVDLVTAVRMLQETATYTRGSLLSADTLVFGPEDAARVVSFLEKWTSS